jgi:hypothetical protein
MKPGIRTRAVARLFHSVAVVAVAVLTLSFSTSAATPPAPPLKVGAAAVTTAKTNVRSTPDGTLVGTQPRYAVGNITVGPTFVSADSAWWVKVSFNSGPSGWVGADMLINGIPTPTSVVVATGLNQNMVLDENGNIEVAYTSSVDSNNNATYSFTESTNQGLSFSAPAVVPMKTIVQPFVPPAQIAAERNGAIDIVYVCPPSQCTFPDSIPGHVLPSIAMIRSTNHGATWSAPIEISVPPVPDRSGASAPVIAACGAGVTIAWIDDGISSQGNVDTFPDLYVVNVDNGAPGAPINVTDDITNELIPQILVNPQGSVYLSWTGQNAAQTANEVFFASIPNCAAVAQ